MSNFVLAQRWDGALFIARTAVGSYVDAPGHGNSAHEFVSVGNVVDSTLSVRFMGFSVYMGGGRLQNETE